MTPTTIKGLIMIKMIVINISNGVWVYVLYIYAN